MLISSSVGIHQKMTKTRNGSDLIEQPPVVFHGGCSELIQLMEELCTTSILRPNVTGLQQM